MLRGLSARDFAKRVYEEASRDYVFNGAAALAFYLTLAIFPAMIFLMTIIPYLPIEHVGQAIMDLLHQALPRSAADMFAGVVQQVAGERRGGLLSVGIIGVLWSASSGMYAVMQQMNIAYNVEERRPFVRARTTALGLTLLFGLLVLGAFSLIVLGGVIQNWIGNRYGFSSALLDFFVVFRWVVIVLGLIIAIEVIYYVAPNRHQRFRAVSTGGGVAAILLIIASFGFSLYASHFGNYDALYGSIGGVVLLMLWFYIAGLVILVGAEINVVLDGVADVKQVEREHGEAAVRRLGLVDASPPRD